MICHAYFSDGMKKLAQCFVRSFKEHNPNRLLVLTSRDLKFEESASIKQGFKNIVIENSSYDYPLLAAKAGLTVAQLKQYKSQIENRYVSTKNKVWKLMIAAEDRPRALFDVMMRYKSDVLHFDIDTLVLRDISDMKEKLNNHDLCMLIREEFHQIKGRITISTIGAAYNGRTEKFFKRWFKHLDDVPPAERPIGYGQTSCYYAYLELLKEVKFLKLNRQWGYPGTKNNGPTNYVWSGAVHKLNKIDCVDYFMNRKEAMLV